jgi:3-oxoacyl-[acyl-carrier protein] reductase
MSDPFDLTGKVALVTGASQGLGRRFAETLARHGATVGLAARQTARLEDLRQAIEAALGPLDVLINNAGVAVSKAVLEQTEADWDKVLGTNLKGAFFTAQAVARRMAERGGGNIVNVASVLALDVVGHLAPYAASKGGLWQLTRTMALELARHQVRVNALAPGYIETEINRDFLATDSGERMKKRIPQRRYGTPEDLDGALLLLASDASRYMTGSIIVIDGGLMLA